MPNPGLSSRRQEAPPPGGALLSPPQRATPACKSVRSGVDDGPAHPHHPRPGKKGQRAPAARPKDGQLGEGESPDPNTTHGSRGRPPPRGGLLPSPQRATPERVLWGR